MHHDPKTGKTEKGTVVTPVDEDQVEHELDEALAETFPPATPSPSIPSRKRMRPVDRALKDSFPASDPAAPAQPHRKSRATPIFRKGSAAGEYFAIPA